MCVSQRRRLLFPARCGARRTRRVASASVHGPRTRASVASRVTRTRAVRSSGVATLVPATRRVRRAPERGRDSTKPTRFPRMRRRGTPRARGARRDHRGRVVVNTYLVTRDDLEVTLCAGGGRWKMRRVARSRGERGFSALQQRAPRVRGREPGRTRRILYGLRSCLKSRSPDVDGKREPWDARSARKNQPHTRVLLVSPACAEPETGRRNPRF